MAENINENQGALTIQMTKLLARLTVKTDSNEIPALQESLVKIRITDTASNTWETETTPQDFSGGHEIKYLPINKELTVNVEAKTKDTDTAIFRGSSKITITEKDQEPECTIEMKRVNGDETSVEIRTLPTPVLEAIYKNGDTFYLTQDTEPPVALFKIYYTDSSNPNSHTPLPDWVTYKWKMNGTEFTTVTPDDTSGQATFKKEEGELTIYLNKMNLNPLGANNNVSQNRLYVEIEMENSEETKSTEIEFTITQ